MSAERRVRTILLAVATAATVAFAAAPCARAQDFYTGKTITIVVGNTVGGGYDMNSRLLARHIGRHIPGNPTVIVANKPGAAGLSAIQYVNNSVPKDGTYLLDFNFGFITDAALGLSPVKLDFTDFNWIGSISQDLSVCLVWGGLGLKTLDEVRASKRLHFGLTAAGSSSNVNTKIVKNVFGFPIHQVAGYPGSAEQRIAIERGELDGQCNPWSSTPVNWITGNKIYPFMKFTPVGASDLPSGVPYALDIAPTPQDAEVIKVLTAAAQLGRPFVAATGVPDDRIAILRDAFDKTMVDPAFRQDAANGRMDVSPKNGAESLAIVRSINNAPPAISDKAKKVLEN